MKAKDVKQAYEENQELKEVGTATQYFKYLKTIFPESKIKEVFLHGTSSPKFEKFRSLYNLDFDYFFTQDMDLADLMSKKKNEGTPRIMKVILNSENPWKWDIEGEGNEVNSCFFDKYAKKGYDAMINRRSVTVYKPEQIHILGSEKDIKGFKEYVKKENKDHSLEKKVASSAFIFIFTLSLCFMSPNITGDVVGSLNKGSSSFIGIILFLISLGGFLAYHKLR